jgi:hypothetical protein
MAASSRYFMVSVDTRLSFLLEYVTDSAKSRATRLSIKLFKSYSRRKYLHTALYISTHMAIIKWLLFMETAVLLCPCFLFLVCGPVCALRYCIVIGRSCSCVVLMCLGSGINNYGT